MRLKMLVGVILAILLPAYSEAQTVCSTSPCAVQSRQAFSAAANHIPDMVDGDTTGYRLKVNGTVTQTLALSALANVNPTTGEGTITFPVTAGLAKGTYTLTIEAYGPGGAAEAVALTVVATPGKPKVPTNLRVIVP